MPRTISTSRPQPNSTTMNLTRCARGSSVPERLQLLAELKPRLLQIAFFQHLATILHHLLDGNRIVATHIRSYPVNPTPKFLLVRQLPYPRTTIRFVTRHRANPQVSKPISVAKDIRPKARPPCNVICGRRTEPRSGGVLQTTSTTSRTRAHDCLRSTPCVDDRAARPTSGRNSSAEFSCPPQHYQRKRQFREPTTAPQISVNRGGTLVRHSGCAPHPFVRGRFRA